jgi:putative ABC transport system permease protein
VEGVAAADALYLEWPLLRNTAERREYLVVALAYDTDRDVLLLPEVVQNSAALRRPETILVDKTSRRFCYGELGVDTPVEINRRRVRVVGTFSLFPNFSTDGHVVMRDQTLFALYADPRARQARENLVDFGLVRVRPGFGLEAVRLALAAALPDDVAVLSKAEMVRRVEQRWATSQPVVPVFGLGMLIGFIIGIMICYQILFTDIEDHRAEMATLKAMGYGNGYLVRVVLQEALTLALLAFLPGLLGSALLYRVLQDLTGVLMEITAPRAGAVLALTVAMCLVSALIAIRKVLRADPAEVF